MKTFGKLVTTFLTISFFFNVAACDWINRAFDRIKQEINPYQTTIFISNAIAPATRNEYCKNLVNYQLFNIEFSFDINNLQLNDSSMKNYDTPQDSSLIIFYTNHLNETESFIDFLVPQLSVRSRPKCLVMSNILSNDASVVSSLKHAWLNKFLDFTIVQLSDEEPMINYLDPFSNTVFWVKFNVADRLFPKKLENAREYPFKSTSFSSVDVVQIRKPSLMNKFVVYDKFFIKFVAKIMNLKVVTTNARAQTPFSRDYLEKRNLDMLSIDMIDLDYSTSFLIPTERESEFDNIFALVPITFTSQVDISIKTLIIFMILIVIICTFNYLFKYFNSAVGKMEVFDILRVFLGQSINREPKKTTERIIFVTLVVASVKMINDFNSDMILLEFENSEKPFDTYKDLWHSGLETYTDLAYLKHIYFSDQTLKNIMSKTVVVNDIKDCTSMLMKQKDRACITYMWDQGIFDSNRSHVGVPTGMKLARPAIFLRNVKFYWFADASPYAMKFHKIMRRVKETNLILIPALTGEHKNICDVHEIEKTTNEGINLHELIMISSSGFLVAVLVFFVEVVKSLGYDYLF